MFGSKAKFHVELTDNKLVYYPQDFVSGNLVINAKEAVDFKDIEVKCKGFAKVHWTEQHGSGDNRRTEHYRAKESYFDLKQTLLKSEGNRKISAGRSEYPFQFQLPTNLPSSIEVKGGYVRYMIKGKIDRSGFFADMKTMILFTVLDVLDLNLIPQARIPVTDSDTKTLCCWCCSSGPIETKVNTNKCGYVPGEFIVANGSIENKSTTDLPESSLYLVQGISQHTRRKSRYFENKQVKVSGPECKAGSTAYLNNIYLQIPALPPSQLRFCNIIDVKYFCMFCVDTAACHINMKLNLPIEIGTIPLQPYDGEPQQQQPFITTTETSFQLPSVPDEPQPSAPVAPTPAQIPPPTYAAATSVEIATKDNYEGTSTSFAPQYSYYDWGQSAFTYN